MIEIDPRAKLFKTLTKERTYTFKDERILKSGKKKVVETEKIAMSKTYTQSIILTGKEKWTTPLGAFGDKCGPT